HQAAGHDDHPLILRVAESPGVLDLPRAGRRRRVGHRLAQPGEESRRQGVRVLEHQPLQGELAAGALVDVPLLAAVEHAGHPARRLLAEPRRIRPVLAGKRGGGQRSGGHGLVADPVKMALEPADLCQFHLQIARLALRELLPGRSGGSGYSEQIGPQSDERREPVMNPEHPRSSLQSPKPAGSGPARYDGRGKEEPDMDWKAIFEVLGVIALVGLVLSGLILAVAFRRLRRLRLPPNPDFFTTVRAVPLSLMVGLDLLDLALESSSSPIIWFLLRRL